MAFEWYNRQNGVDDVDADDINAVAQEVIRLGSDKVDKDGDKQLSDENYTSKEKTKLASLENYDDTELTNQVKQLDETKVSQDELNEILPNYDSGLSISDGLLCVSFNE